MTEFEQSLSPELRAVFKSGEVLHPDAPGINPLFQRHLAAYQFCAEFCEGKDVLDVGIGEGYGTALIAEKSQTHTGLEFNPVLAKYASEKYGREKLTIKQGSAEALPFDNETFDTVINLQLIEHLPDWPKFIREAHRVLRPGGVMVSVTPNPRMMLSGVNPYHYKEFTPEELVAAMQKVFPNVEGMGLFASDRYMELKKGEQEFAKKLLKVDPLNIRSIIPRWLIKGPYRLAFAIVNSKTNQEETGRGVEITVDDFFVRHDNLTNALESITVARKAEAAP